MSRAVSVVVERSPGGLNGFHCVVAGLRTQLFGTDLRALAWVRDALMALGTPAEERVRVLGLVVKELAWKTKAEVTAEVSFV